MYNHFNINYLSSVAVNFDLFLKELNDNSLLRVYEEESINHVPPREMDTVYDELVGC